MKLNLKTSLFISLVFLLCLSGCTPSTSEPSVEPSASEYTINFDLDGGYSPSNPGSVTFVEFSKNLFFFDVSKQGYEFSGWSFEGTKIFDEDANQLATPTLKENMTFVAEYSQNVTLNITKNIDEAGEVIGEGEYPFYSEINLKAIPNEGYSFVGWYLNENCISEESEYLYSLSDEDITIEARFSINSYIVNIISSQSVMGKIKFEEENEYKETSSKTVKYLDVVTVIALSNKSEFEFLGWFDSDGVLLSGEYTYTFEMVSHNYTLFAKWNSPAFKVDVIKNINEAGNVDGTGEYFYGAEVTLSAIDNSGYEFIGWYSNDELISNHLSYSFLMPYENVTYEARWKLLEYSIEYVLDGGTNHSDNPTNFTINDSFELFPATKLGYVFNGWTFNGEAISEIKKGTCENITLIASWDLDTFKMNIQINDSSFGSVSGAGEYAYLSQVTIVATPNDGYEFIGWFENENDLISEDLTYIFTMPYQDLTYLALFDEIGSKEDWEKDHGVIPVLDEENKTITYGLYPQTHVADQTLIDELNKLTELEDSGFYFYENEYYAKQLCVDQNSQSYKYFDDGEKMTLGQIYWFKCEPIIWKILSQNDKEYFLVSDLVIDSCIYHRESNNYYYSHVREWLNTIFYTSAFYLDCSFITVSSVNNSASTTDSASNPNACANTDDRIFLLSYQDYINPEYGFENTASVSSSRYFYSSDYSRCRGTYVEAHEQFPYYKATYSWTRSPSSFSSNVAWYIQPIGALYKSLKANTTYIGIRPCFNLIMI